MTGKIPFDSINQSLLARSEQFLRDLFPHGKIHGREFCIGNISGEPGESLKINLSTGIGADFASGETFGDLIAVYAAAKNIGMGEAAKQLSNGAGEAYRTPQVPATQSITRPPRNAPEPQCHHHKHGEPAAVYRYADSDGTLHYVARYNVADGKEIVPWSWDSASSRWVAKGYPKPRPLYGLDQLQAKPAAQVIIVEGEKCVDFLRALNVSRVPITFSGGVSGAKHSDLSPLTGRDVLLFPDHDEPGLKCMLELAAQLTAIAGSVKIIDHASDDLPTGWDIADTTWTGAELNAWARDRIKPITPPPVADSVPAKRGKPRTKQDGSNPNGETIDHATGSVFVSWEQLGLDRNSRGTPHDNVSNVLKILAGHPDLAGRIWFDEFHGCVFSTLFSDQPREWTDNDDTRMMAYLQSTMRMPKTNALNTRRAVDQYAENQMRNAVTEYLSGLEWDKIERLHTLLADVYGTPTDPYHAAVGRTWIVGMIARAFDPGCKLDTVLVLEGSQGLQKSTSLEILGGRWYLSIADKFGQRDFLQAMDGGWLIELPDMSNFRGSDIDHVKAIITTRWDRYCRRYSRRAGTYPRRSVFTATANGSQWNTDPSGARRFFPVSCREVNLDYLRENRNQIFAEAISIYQRVPQSATAHERMAAGADWWTVPSEDAREHQEARYQIDPWDDIVREYAAGRDSISIPLLLSNAINLPPDRQGRAESNRVAAILRSIGFDCRVVREGTRTLKRWIRIGNRVTSDQKKLLSDQ